MTNEDDNENYDWELTFGAYQEQARQTAIYPNNAAVVYPTLGLCNEAGEFAGKVKKNIRDATTPNKEELAAELGDVLWYVAMCAYDLGLDLSYIANKNLDKLFDRAQRGVLGGSGDNR